MSMPDSAMLLSSVSRISPVPPPKSVRNKFAEMAVDGLEGFAEALARLDVDIVDGFLGVADGIEQVLALRVQKIVALLRFLEFFERLRIHRAQRFDARLDFLVFLLGFGESGLVEHDFFACRQFFERSVQFLAAGFVQVLQLGLLLHQLEFDLRALLLRSLDDRGAVASAFPRRSRDSPRSVVSCSARTRDGFLGEA